MLFLYLVAGSLAGCCVYQIRKATKQTDADAASSTIKGLILGIVAIVMLLIAIAT